MMPIGQFGVDGCHLIDGGRAQCGLGDHQGGRQGGGTGAARNIGAGELWSCWWQYMLLEHLEVTVVIEMVAASRMTGRCTRWERWLPGSGGGLKVLNRNLHSFQLLEIIQVLDSISWVLCFNTFWVLLQCLQLSTKSGTSKQNVKIRILHFYWKIALQRIRWRLLALLFLALNFI